MSSNSEQQRQQLKEEYKEHYRKIRDAKEKLRRSKYVQNVNEALHKMNSDELLESVDQFLGNVRHKMASIEARLDVAMEAFLEESPNEGELDEEIQKENARESLKKIKMEMGLLYREIEEQARELRVEKTVGTGKQDNSPEEGSGQHS